MDSGGVVGAGTRDFSNLKAALFVLISTGFFAAMFTAGKFAGDSASAVQIMFLRYLGGFLTIVVLALVTRHRWSDLQSRRRHLHVMRALTGAAGGVAVIYGNANMPVADANAISMLSVVFLVGLGMVFLGDRPRLWHGIAIVTCIAGAAVIMASRGAFTQFEPAYLVPAGVTLLAAMFMATEGLFIKILSTVDRPLTTLAHVNLFGTLLLLVPALLTWGSPGLINLAFLALGPLAIAAQYCNIRAHMLASVTVLAPISYVTLIYAGLIGWVFFSEVPTLGGVAGAALIAAGGITLALTRR